LELVSQRVYGLALGYDDLNDHDRLRCDPMLALAVGKGGITGNDRVRERDRGNALAGKSSFEHTGLALPRMLISPRTTRSPGSGRGLPKDGVGGDKEGAPEPMRRREPEQLTLRTGRV